MKSFALAILCTAVSWMAGVNAVVIGPFALYTKSEDPTWNMRYIDVGYRTGYNAIGDHISDPSQIPQEYVNYFINSTGLSDPTSDTGNLVWGPQTFGSYMRISAFYGTVGVFDPTSPIQPIYFELGREESGYTTEWSLSAGGQLLLAGASQFYGHYLQAPFWNYDALFWGFGGNSTQLPSNTSAVTLWKYP